MLFQSGFYNSLEQILFLLFMQQKTLESSPPGATHKIVTCFTDFKARLIILLSGTHSETFEHRGEDTLESSSLDFNLYRTY